MWFRAANPSSQTEVRKPTLSQFQRVIWSLEPFFAPLSRYRTSKGDIEMDDSMIWGEQKEYFDGMTIAYSTFMAVAVAALALPSLNGNQQSLGAIACFTLTFSLSLLGFMLVLYLKLAIRRALNKYIRPKSRSSFPLLIPGVISVFSALPLLIGILVLAFGSFDNESTSPPKMIWYLLLVTIPVCATFLLCFAVVLSSEVHAWACRRAIRDLNIYRDDPT
ncbi:hypothetical protein FRC12_000648 [Ceratobasidium sp. 428]|nr:hypothetical protein FRC12_000648 [Ceratobasidium sp. 428]